MRFVFFLDFIFCRDDVGLFTSFRVSLLALLLFDLPERFSFAFLAKVFFAFEVVLFLFFFRDDVGLCAALRVRDDVGLCAALRVRFLCGLVRDDFWLCVDLPSCGECLALSRLRWEEPFLAGLPFGPFFIENFVLYSNPS